MKALLLALLSLSAYAQTFRLLEDFSSMRQNGQPAGTLQCGSSIANLWACSGTNSSWYGQTISLENGQLKNVVAAANPGYYVHFYPYFGGYPEPPGLGHTQMWLRSGTWASNINRMRLQLKCTADLPSSLNSASLNIGTYTKDPLIDSSAQGAHFYHYFHPAIKANRWINLTYFDTPTHKLGSNPGYNWWANMTQAQEEDSAGWDYMDGLTRWYLAIDTGTGEPQYTCWIKDVQVFDQAGEPDSWVANTSAQYTGTQYEVTFSSIKGSPAVAYKIYHHTSSIRTAGISAATYGGSVNSDASSYAYTRWYSGATAEVPSKYFAIRPLMRVDGVSKTNPARINVTVPHNLTTGDTVNLAGINATLNGARTITAVPSQKFGTNAGTLTNIVVSTGGTHIMTVTTASAHGMEVGQLYQVPDGGGEDWFQEYLFKIDTVPSSTTWTAVVHANLPDGTYTGAGLLIVTVPYVTVPVDATGISTYTSGGTMEATSDTTNFVEAFINQQGGSSAMTGAAVVSGRATQN